MPTALDPCRRGRLRRAVSVLGLGLAIVLLVRTWLVEGFLGPWVVPSGSMAPTLLGSHRRVRCPTCESGFVCDAHGVPETAAVGCPRCGQRIPLVALPAEGGDRVLMDRATWRFWGLARWDVIAFADPARPSRVLVKRVVGLPGESVQIRHGDVYIDGRIARKPISRTRAMAVLVDDADEPGGTAEAPQPRWRPEPEDAPWGSSQGRFAHPERPEPAPVDWLVYHHTAWIGGRAEPRPIRDENLYNAARPRRIEDVREVTDLVLSFRVRRRFGRGRLAVRMTDGVERFEVWLDPARGRVEVRRGDRSLPVVRADVALPEGPFSVEAALVDARLEVALAGQTVARVDYEPAAERRPGPCPVAIGSAGLGVELDRIRVYRDVYYTHPIGPVARWGVDQPVTMGQDAFFVLGDNSPVSEDSRTWAGGPSVCLDRVVGRPVVVHFPPRELTFWGFHIQVPDLSRIRYIR